LRNKFGIHHNAGSKFVYTIGGKVTNKGDNLNSCMKFDITKLKWVSMPNLNAARFAPGLFVSSDANVLYAFGGQENSVERIVLSKPDAQWQLLDVELPDDIANKYGFACLPSWKVSAIIPEISDSSVLVFGGHCEKVHVYDISAEGMNHLVSSDGTDVNIEEDYFFTQPVVEGDHIILVG